MLETVKRLHEKSGQTAIAASSSDLAKLDEVFTKLAFRTCSRKIDALVTFMYCGKTHAFTFLKSFFCSLYFC